MLEQACSSPFSSLFPFDQDHDDVDDEDRNVVKNIDYKLSDITINHDEEDRGMFFF